MYVAAPHHLLSAAEGPHAIERNGSDSHQLHGFGDRCFMAGRQDGGTGRTFARPPRHCPPRRCCRAFAPFKETFLSSSAG